MVETFAKDLGLQLNCTKSELICSKSSVLEVMVREVPGLQERDPDSAELLDSPIGGIEAINTTIKAKIGKLQLLGDRLCLLHSHDALFLLRHSFAIPKMLYVLRTAPCFLSPFLDSLFRDFLSGITNISMGANSVWIQATLAVKFGGLGVRRATQLAPSVFFCFCCELF